MRKNTKWTPKIEAWVRSRVPFPKGKTKAAFLAELNEVFGTDFTLHAFTTFLCTKNIQTGIKPYQVGQHRGIVNYNLKPVGYERISKGYVKIKIANPNVWKFKHIMLWEKANGESVDGNKETVIFLDGNTRNFDASNLYRLTKREQYYRNSRFPKAQNAAENLVYIALTKQRLALIDKAKELKLTTEYGNKNTVIISERRSYYQERKKDPEFLAKQTAYRKTYIQRLRAENPEKYAQILERHRKWYREKYKKKV